jgi:hypothetical protein
MTKEREYPHKISFESFTLGFMEEKTDGSSEEDGEELSSAETLDRMEAALPSAARFLGRVDDEVENFTSWKIEDHYFLLPWEGQEFDYALVRISWDDNWGRFEWGACSRICGEKDPDAAARKLVSATFKNWNIDLDDPERAAYQDFLKTL